MGLTFVQMLMVVRFLAHARLPVLVAFAAALFMVSSLWSGLVGDDLVQRPTQFKAADLPSRLLDTGFVPEGSGELSTVLGHLFGYVNTGEKAVKARDYGIAPWWAKPGWRAALFRPVTAFTHWLDYRLYPNNAAWMHAHSILWFAWAVFLAGSAYRKLAIASNDAVAKPSEATSINPEPGIVRTDTEVALAAAGLAACLFALDPKTYFPVMYVANRGFIIALVFGLLSLHAHINWRTTRRIGWMWLSALSFLMSLLANEGGVSSLAFLIPYALLLERGQWRSRWASLVPVALVLVGWRAVYAGFGFGVRNFLLYIDPGYEPLLFVKNLWSRANGLLGGQLSGIPPELALGLNPKWQILLAAGFALFVLLCMIAFIPTLGRDKVARFWATAMLLAAVPAATVYPITKNMAFIAVGAFGLIAAFMMVVTRHDLRRTALPSAIVSSFIAIWLLIAHVPAAFAARIGLATLSPRLPALAAHACSFQPGTDLGDRYVVIVNDPTLISFVVPFDHAYRGLPLPRAVRTLVPGSTRLQVRRADISTLIVSATNADLFDSPELGAAHFAYALKSANKQLFGSKIWKCGERVTCKGFAAEILELSPRGMPRSVAFHFEQSLDSGDMAWFFFDWRQMSHSPFPLPSPGETMEIPGAGIRQDPGKIR